MYGFDRIKHGVIVLYLCLGIVRFIRANESEAEEEIAAPLYLNENHLNNRIARSIDPYSYYWNDLKRGDPSHLLRFAKRSGGMDDHMLRFAKKKWRRPFFAICQKWNG